VPAKTRLFLARHAEPENPDGVFYGHLPGFGLSAGGRRQARALGKALAAAEVAAVFSSPLERARETATLAAKELPLGPKVELRDELLETGFGRYIQGIPRAQMLVRRPLFIVHLLRPGLLPGDESVDEMADRVGRTCAEALAAARGKAALLVSHADPIKAFWNRYLGRPGWRFHLLRLAKGSWLELDYEGERLLSAAYHGPLVGPYEDAAC